MFVDSVTIFRSIRRREKSWEKMKSVGEIWMFFLWRQTKWRMTMLQFQRFFKTVNMFLTNFISLLYIVQKWLNFLLINIYFLIYLSKLSNSHNFCSSIFIKTFYTNSYVIEKNSFLSFLWITPLSSQKAWETSKLLTNRKGWLIQMHGVIKKWSTTIQKFLICIHVSLR